jgi:hypothetical protein
MAKFSSRRASTVTTLIFLVLVSGTAGAASLSIPSLELVTRGFTVESVFALESYGKMELSIDGGDKFGGKVSFEYLNYFLEQNPIGTSLTFVGASLTVQDVFTLPISPSWFVGENDRLSDGIHEVNGTGLKIEFSPIPEKLLLSLYAYQDSNFILLSLMPDGTTRSLLLPGYYSADFRVRADLGSVTIDAFVGTTYAPISPYGYYRGGVLFHAKGETVEFYSQIGMPKYDPLTDPSFTFNLFFILFEPRLHLGIFSLVPTFFWHPGYYLQQPTGEAGSFDVNVKMALGDLSQYGVLGGLESKFSFESATTTFSFVTSPFLEFMAMDMLWTIKGNWQVAWPIAPADFSGQLGILAHF